MNTLDEPIKGERVLCWQTIKKDGKNFTLQVYLRHDELERLVAEQVDKVVFAETFHSGAISFSITRQS